MKMGDETQKMMARRPLKNFVFFPAIQMPQIVRNSLLVVGTALGTGITVLFLYFWQYGSTDAYVLSSDSRFLPLERRSVVMLVMPAVLATATMAIMLGWLLALAASRRIALPIFKVIQWCRLVAEGNLRARIGFRPHDRLDELSEACNQALDHVRHGYEEIAELEKDPSVPEAVRTRLTDILSKYRF